MYVHNKVTFTETMLQYYVSKHYTANMEKSENNEYNYFNVFKCRHYNQYESL